MKNLNFDFYFDNVDSKYYDSKYIITVLENILGSKFGDIKNAVSSAQVVVTKEQVKEFLRKRFEEDDSELKKRIENFKPKRSMDLAEWTDEDIKESSKEFFDDIRAVRYCFEPYALEYFNRYTTILRNKTLLLLNVIEKIGNRDTISIYDLITELDIQLDENDNISKEDIIRLITPTVYNIGELNEKVSKANDLSTYLNFKVSKNSLYRDDLFENQIYPSLSLQIKDLAYDHVKGYVPLSSTQRIELKQKYNKNMKKCAKMLTD